MSGFPDGCPALVRPLAWYDEQHVLANDAYDGVARLLPSAWLVWEPALDRVRGGVLDAGCGQGHLAEICALRGISYVCGVDGSEVAITKARQRAPAAHFEVGDPTVFLRSASYETAVLLEFLEHIWDDLGTLSAVPEGKRVVASVPSFWTDGHCRWFDDSAEVRARYGAVVDIDDVMTRSLGGSRWYVFSGMRTGVIARAEHTVGNA